jgi:hypothetical protein
VTIEPVIEFGLKKAPASTHLDIAVKGEDEMDQTAHKQGYKTDV